MNVKKKGFRDIKIPDDLGVKLGTKEQVLWETVKRETQAIIEQAEKQLIFNKEVLKMAETKIQEETEKLK